ncbi:MAG: NADH-quinone oxidoreductase subunit J [Alphaproteobacteria bacterium]|uniref:NADH-quinone oxidoreductase subunit J n=1 Tax=PS1 clade bacterium TaxID=2175152 RepID=A0A368DK91_9PROT|nr:NADH:ubiquinone oxidoreductase subunit J [Rhodobiaceae bacterium]OUT73803.1 MAG: NADH:ubiquinone oxidoreductase subunit J [Rhizobiales bacterium TMED25]RCL72260.1 MAG: NADH-quinone oxidoreductase subunit J [PS1 clade bacterium]|tara:strand:+ start:2528 stop:3136 length:609 start_codon:yes stop_codon:yes gene_type:complete
MLVINILFYLFSFIMIASAFMVVLSRNPVHSVLFLILCFFNSAGIFLILGAEFLAFILVIVYVGAVAVLFLFVVMMLDVEFNSSNSSIISYLPVGMTIGFIILSELILVFFTWKREYTMPDLSEVIVNNQYTNTETLGLVLYTENILFFQLAGLILLASMIGAIVLTVNHRPSAKRQDIVSQVNRDSKNSIKNVNIKPGSGI